jgi:hypothetical protein
MLIYTYSKTYTQELAIELIPLGIDPIETIDVADVERWVEKDSSLNVLLTESPDVDFLQFVRQKNPALHIFLIAHSSVKPADLIRISKLGIQSIINFQDNSNQLAEDVIRTVIQQNIRTQDKRLHVRVQPKSFEKLMASIYIRPRNRFLYGSIIDISAGGVAIRIPEEPDSEHLISGALFDPLILSLKGSDVKTVSTMVGKRQNFAGFKFDNVETRDMRIIADYVHSRLMDNARNFMDRFVRGEGIS